MTIRAIIASHRFHPGHLSHLLANARLLREAGFAVSFRWHPRFGTMLNHGQQVPTESMVSVLLGSSSSVYVLWFPSIIGLLDILLLRLLFRPVQVIYVLHEPYTSYASYRAAGFPRLKAAKVYLIHLMSAAVVRLSDAVILPSNNAQGAFNQRYAGCTTATQVVPLMFDDEAAVGPKTPDQRQFISYIGTVAEDHAFDRFVDFAEQALSRGLVGDQRFLIATRSQLDTDTARRLAPFVAAGQMEIQSGRPLSNEEINTAFSKSTVVWNAYKRSMQSGVLPKSYMFGTPVLVSETNTSEFFDNGRHGVLVSARYDTAELSAAVHAIHADFNRYSANCRAAFLQHFHYRANSAGFLAALRRAPSLP